MRNMCVELKSAYAIVRECSVQSHCHYQTYYRLKTTNVHKINQIDRVKEAQ